MGLSFRRESVKGTVILKGLAADIAALNKRGILLRS